MEHDGFVEQKISGRVSVTERKTTLQDKAPVIHEEKEWFCNVCKNVERLDQERVLKRR